jgi:hypothetical protein
MRNLRESFILGLGVVGLVACGDDGGKAASDAPKAIDAAPQIDAPKQIDAMPDAPPPNYDFSCEGQPLSTAGVDPISLAGTVTEIQVDLSGPSINQVPLQGMTVKVYQNQMTQGAALGTSTSDATGAWATNDLANTGAGPFDAYAIGTKDAYRTTYVYPPAPFNASATNVPVLTFSNQTFSLLGLAGIQQDADKGLLAIDIMDCAQTPVEGATVHVTQDATADAEVGDQPSLPSGGGGGTMGAKFVTNVPPGKTHLVASFGTHTWRLRDIGSFAGADTTTILTP